MKWGSAFMSTTPLLDLVYEALVSGCLSMAQERKMYKLLDTYNFDDVEMAAIDWLMDALRNGVVRPVA
jgi:hypothetical protein